MVAIAACPVGSAHEAAPAQHFPVQGKDTGLGLDSIVPGE